MIKLATETANKKFDEHNQQMIDTAADDMIYLDKTSEAELK